MDSGPDAPLPQLAGTDNKIDLVDVLRVSGHEAGCRAPHAASVAGVGGHLIWSHGRAPLGPRSPYSMDLGPLDLVLAAGTPVLVERVTSWLRRLHAQDDEGLGA